MIKIYTMNSPKSYKSYLSSVCYLKSVVNKIYTVLLVSRVMQRQLIPDKDPSAITIA